MLDGVKIHKRVCSTTINEAKKNQKWREKPREEAGKRWNDGKLSEILICKTAAMI